MEKIKLEIVGLSYSQTQSGAYALVLGETEGTRRLPIIIGGFEAQSIAIELESMTPSRPLTHDLFKNFAESFEIKVKEVIVYNLVEGIFYSKLICEYQGKEVEIDARTSDAIALALRFKCQVFTYEFILNSAGIQLEEGDSPITEVEEEEEDDAEQPEKSLRSMSVSELEKKLDDAIEQENYELATQLRDEINRRQSES